MLDVPTARLARTADTAQRFAVSAAATEGVAGSVDDVRAWFAGRSAAHRFSVTEIPFAELAGWGFARDTGNLVHDSGRFFSVEGLAVRTDAEHGGSWVQPVINQPEIGLLGLLAREFDGVLHFLMQAKMEPGNINSLQLSPTVQATRSNYTGVHKGSAIRYLEHFGPGRTTRVLADGLQSEQGSWFLAKRNRNMVVETHDDIEPHEDFVWLTLGQLHRLLAEDNLINMDSRTVLSVVPTEPARGAFALHSTAEVLSALTETRARRELVRRLVPLTAAYEGGWHRTDTEIAHDDGRYFRVVAVDVRATGREVASWTQPLLAPARRGLAAFLVKEIAGVRHVLARARVEAGAHSVAELAPTVQCDPVNYVVPPPYLREVQQALAGDRARVLYDVVHSEEGGRFHHAENRYALIAADDHPVDVPDGFQWVAAHQLHELLGYGNFLDVEARTLIACLRSLS
ncbi:NDP-hexose 2,3-dehydratase [Streptomyces sp. SID8379]|uniref:NDP-hexose 2,3-dehydratase family protein n=1 Tax=unclassified Streptomyces TaxID=2593676 RepID=UPI000362C03E|nr:MULTISPECIES: NDP-hexose 2,3-dehydratase family protein [unclassified Streptomyces]MYW65859.1 NDP-hexose 2,3-dehydratase [Streptomyces sp. SID8379]